MEEPVVMRAQSVLHNGAPFRPPIPKVPKFKARPVPPFDHIILPEKIKNRKDAGRAICLRD